MSKTTIAVIGLGEAGQLYASGFTEAGAAVTGYDPYTDARGTGIDQRHDLADALRGADIVASLVGAQASESVAKTALAQLAPKTIYADLNTASPQTKRRIAAEFAAAGIRFADVAVLAPVPRAGHRTPLLASGTGADELAKRLRPLGTPIESIGGQAGDAAARKLLRSVFMKGLAALVIETTTAADAADQGGWIRGQMASELGPEGEATVERLITGTRMHARRRQHEVQDALAYLDELGCPSWTTQATLTWIRSLVPVEEAS